LFVFARRLLRLFVADIQRRRFFIKLTRRRAAKGDLLESQARAARTLGRVGKAIARGAGRRGYAGANTQDLPSLQLGENSLDE